MAQTSQNSMSTTALLCTPLSVWVHVPDAMSHTCTSSCHTAAVIELPAVQAVVLPCSLISCLEKHFLTMQIS